MMKMHPKPMKRHTQHVEKVTTSFTFDYQLTETPYKVTFYFESNFYPEQKSAPTQVLVMDREEAMTTLECLATMLRYEDTPARDVDPEEWQKFFSDLRALVNKKD